MSPSRTTCLSLSVLACVGFWTAASAHDLTRAEVRADLIRVEQAGYKPSAANDVHYPNDIQAAEAKIAAQSGQQGINDAVGGSVMNGTSADGGRVSRTMSSGCVGPASFCDIYFGN